MFHLLPLLLTGLVETIESSSPFAERSLDDQGVYSDAMRSCRPPVGLVFYVSHQVYIFKPSPLVLESLIIHDPIDIALANEVIRPIPTRLTIKGTGLPGITTTLSSCFANRGIRPRCPFFVQQRRRLSSAGLDASLSSWNLTPMLRDLKSSTFSQPAFC